MAAQWWGIHYETATNSIWYDPGLPEVYKKIAVIKNPSQRFLFVDAIGYNRDAYFAIWYSRPRWWNIPQVNHGDGSVNGYADGHVARYKMKIETVKMAENGNIGGGYQMQPDDVPNSRDLKYYQRAIWGKCGWQP